MTASKRNMPVSLLYSFEITAEWLKFNQNIQSQKKETMKKIILAIVAISSFIFSSMAQYPDNESGPIQDLITPEYYATPTGGAFRTEINKFVFFARAIPFRNPLEDSFGNIPSYTIPAEGTFEVGKGPGGTAEHHAANDLHVGTDDTLVTMYAAHDGYVNTYYGALKYRDYLTITTDVKDDNNVVLGKMVTIYGHLDLAHDTTAGLFMDGQYVNQGDLVSNYLYSGTVGGPHLHLEIRYYRLADLGTESFYGFIGTGLTDPAAGIWQYGLWNPTVGYAVAQPDNHLSSSMTAVDEVGKEEELRIYPNPSKGAYNIRFTGWQERFEMQVYDALGRKVYRNTVEASDVISVDLSHLDTGTYTVNIDLPDGKKYTRLIVRD